MTDAPDNQNDEVTIEPELDEERGGKDPKEAIKKLKEELAKVAEEKQKYLDSWQRDKAEFLNARKRDKEVNEQMLKYSNEGLIGELVPVLESFNHAFSNKEAWEKVDKNWRVGVEYIANQLKSVLESAGLKEINPLGQKFDPMRDEAIAHEPVTDEKMDHIITAVVSKGYEFNGKQMTAPKVKVGEFKK